MSRVVVRLRADATDAAAVARAQDSVLQALQGSHYRLLHRYAASPFLALEVGPDALQILQTSPVVVSVAPDISIEPKGGRQ